MLKRIRDKGNDKWVRICPRCKKRILRDDDVIFQDGEVCHIECGDK